MTEPGLRILGAASSAEDFWGRSLDRTHAFDDQRRRCRDPADAHESPRESGREYGRDFSRDPGSGHYRDYDRGRNHRDSDMKRRDDDRARYRERDYYPNNHREEYDSYRGGGANRNDRRRCYICNTPGHIAIRHNAWALTHQRHVAGSIGITEPVHLSINSRAQLSILPQRIPRQQELMPPVNLSAMATAWQQYLVPGMVEVGNALAALQSAAVAMGAAAPHAEIAAIVASWDQYITPGRVRMERSLAAMGSSHVEGYHQEGRVSSSTTTYRDHSQDEPKYFASETLVTMTDAVNVEPTNVDNGYDFDIY
ncbi:hypothetical protein N7522_006936 [Penicillium canescens]|nr:hypothetical protein N7522_006936 [Penicillium canescens]